ncbi:methionine ABC transporter substrate-binding protein [Leifsonia sp. Root227]|jgi:D-methionine transport system substrate-binding protein|uniref:MetQ/NlpA family ABC transporter substrate-binding protein n=1 Tax=Leifsonia sp. Root227 TaxID=1736496 RepID=UPI0006FA0628|nr:MetQ/NlpA family ABC transporter substrate-binding protein [Leifsonia sp. Root227]KRC49768.1 methionine ABC transporter substrate-binding protein [Leifsonia sp. Root227]
MSEATPPTPSLPEKPKSKTGWIVGIGIAVIAVIVAVVLIIVNVTAPASNGAEKRVTVKIGTTEQAAPYWTILKKAAAKEGIDIQVVGFRDYTQANPALADKQIDLNLFQHLQFLANYDVNANQNLVPISSTQVVPLPLYSKKYTKLDEIPQGAKIAIPNDATNQARALLVLQKAGLLKLANGGNTLATPADIVASDSKVSVIPVDAAQTAPALDSADGAIINNNFALTAGIDPKSALFQDDPKSDTAEPYINAFVARAADKDNKTYLKVAELYHTKPVTDAVLAESKNTAVIVDRPQADLISILDKLKTTIKAAK